MPNPGHSGLMLCSLLLQVLKRNLADFVDLAISNNLEPLVEIHTADEAAEALSTKATLIGINNRNLETFGIDRSTTRILSDRIRLEDRLIISESGMRSADDIREMKQYL